ncbi:MAG: MFS transporter [Caldilineaceae bacterium]
MTPTADSSRREQYGWYFYDWANSAFSTTVVTVFLGPYLTAVTQQAADANGFVHPLGIPVLADSFFPYMVSLSVLLQVFFLRPSWKRWPTTPTSRSQMLGVFAYIGAFATMALYFLPGRQLPAGRCAVSHRQSELRRPSSSTTRFWRSPGRTSATGSVPGWALGYLGGGLLLAANLVLLSQRRGAGAVHGGMRCASSMASAGVWWAIFTLIPLLAPRRHRPRKSLPPGERYLTVGFTNWATRCANCPNFPHAALPVGLPALQRRHPDRDCAVIPVRQPELGMGESSRSA